MTTQKPGPVIVERLREWREILTRNASIPLLCVSIDTASGEARLLMGADVTPDLARRVLMEAFNAVQEIPQEARLWRPGDPS